MDGMNHPILLQALALPFALSVFCFILPKYSKWIALLAEAAVLILACRIVMYGYNGIGYMNFEADILSSYIFMAASVFTLLITLFSFKFMEGRNGLGEYYGYVLITLGAAAGVLFAADYFTLLSFWGIIAATLYMLIAVSGPEASKAAKKALITVGGTDALMAFGIGVIWLFTRSLQIGHSSIPLIGALPVIAFLCLAAGAFAKAGAVPFHGWIAGSSSVAYAPVMAFLPASLDKLLAIYLMTRLCTSIFIVLPNSPVSIFLLFIGSLTILVGVLAALLQHDIKKLLAFHAVSQVGYMILGIGTALPVGIAGGLFHMLNNAIYKSCLFLSAGSIEKRTGTTELDKLGGLGKYMPITFISAAAAALAISGVPPMNGFFSKWMIYQGIIQLSRTSNLWVIWLVAAMFGSALTLASFIKLVHGIFMGQSSHSELSVKEAPYQMWLPPAILAFLCVIFGIFAFPLPLNYFIIPSVKGIIYGGDWNPALASALLIMGLLIGVVIFIFGRIGRTVTQPPYIGGELAKEADIKVPSTDFYGSIKDYRPLGAIYNLAEKGAFDMYRGLSKLADRFSGIFSSLHSGYLNTYITWVLLGFALMLIYIIFI